ncbi:MAG: ribosome recycling factor [Thermomicrobia bacterium]|nr:ribosome recycling factor [Thermomicrobia bacterium]
MYEEILQDADDRMRKAVEALRGHLSSIRTGRASTGLIERLIVDYYGAETPLQQLAGISAPEARMLVVQPWDKGSMKAIEKSIRASDLGLNPTNDGQVLRITIPALTEERRRDLVKIAKRNIEEAHVAIRNIRRDAIHLLKELDEGGEISEDQRRRGEEQIQKLTDRGIADADKVGREKETEILEV